MDLQKILIAYVERQKKIHKKYSLSDLSKNSGVSKTSLSEFLNGNRELTPENKIKLATVIIQSKKSFNYFVEKNSSISKIAKKREKILKKTQFSYISDWEYFAILASVYLKNSSSDTQWISKTLNIPHERAVECLEQLLNLKLIKITNSKIIRQGYNISSPRGESNQDIKKNHSQSINLADEKLYEIPIERREYITSNLCIAEKDFNPLRQDIIKFYKKIAKKYTKYSDGDHLYKLNIQFFPISSTFEQSEKKKGD